MPEPVTVLLGGLALLLVVGLVSFSRYNRLREHIDESAAAIVAERERRDRLVTDLRQTRAARRERPTASGAERATEERMAEQVEEAEDRLEAVNRLHTAQVRAWNRLGTASHWRLLRGLTGWRPMPEQPLAQAPERRAATPRRTRPSTRAEHRSGHDRHA